MDEGVRLMIVLPQYAGWTHGRHMMSVVGLVRALTEAGVEYEVLAGSDSAVHRNRYLLTESFLRARVPGSEGDRPDAGVPYSHMLFIDGDIEFAVSDVVRLLDMNADVAVGAYRLKREGAELAAWHDGALLGLDDLPDEPFEVDYAGTGFMLIKREVFERIGESLPWVRTEQHGLQRRWWSFDMDGQAELPEDFGFCKRVREAGMSIMMDPKIELKHWGMKGW